MLFDVFSNFSHRVSFVQVRTAVEPEQDEFVEDTSLRQVDWKNVIAHPPVT